MAEIHEEQAYTHDEPLYEVKIEASGTRLNLAWGLPASEYIELQGTGYDFLTAPQAREFAQQLVIAAEHIEAAQKEGQE